MGQILTNMTMTIFEPVIV